VKISEFRVTGFPKKRVGKFFGSILKQISLVSGDFSSPFPHFCTVLEISDVEPD